MRLQLREIEERQVKVLDLQRDAKAKHLTHGSQCSRRALGSWSFFFVLVEQMEVETLGYTKHERWQHFVQSLSFTTPLEFNEGDRGMAGGIQASWRTHGVAKSDWHFKGSKVFDSKKPRGPLLLGCFMLFSWLVRLTLKTSFICFGTNESTNTSKTKWQKQKSNPTHSNPKHLTKKTPL